jgi:hypothetical protein
MKSKTAETLELNIFSLTKKESGLPLLLFVVTVLSRLPFTSRMLFTMDSAQYARALDNFDVVAHQPHPPGYFLYVMAGRLFHLFIPDPNLALIALSITCSALAVVVIHDLGKRMGGATTGLLAALFAITSPNFWFHGEVALNYAVEVFLSATVALLCWRIIHEEDHLVWILAIFLAITGGVRQSSAVFLFPLCIFSMRKLSASRYVNAAILYILATLAWVVPMLLMAGVDAYFNAFRELLRFTVAGGSVFSKGLERFILYTSYTHTAITLSIGAGVVIMGLAMYHVLRNHRIKNLYNGDTLFLIAWGAPALFFFTMIANHPGVPGFIMILLPPLVILLAMSVRYLGREFPLTNGNNTTGIFACIVLSVNIVIFTLLHTPVSARSIRNHDKNLQSLVETLRGATDKNSALFIIGYVDYSLWHLATYLPDRTICNVDTRRDKQGKVRQVFYCHDGKIRTADRILLAANIKKYISISLDNDKSLSAKCGSTISSVAGEIFITTGPIKYINCVYPELTQIQRGVNTRP